MAVNEQAKKVKNKGGRPSLYKEEYANLAFNYCLLGAIDEDLASFFNVAVSTINKWKIDYPLFLESLKKGKEEADAQIALSLFNRAKGAIIHTQQAFKVKEVTVINGKRTEIESVKIVNLQQEQPPDTTAAIFWLKNRRPDRWRDKVEVLDNNKPSLNISVINPKIQEEIDKL